MKRILFAISCCMVMSLSLMAQSSVDERCHKIERGGCPFKIGDLFVLDRCTGSNPLDPQKTSIGNTLCDAFNNVDIIVDNVNKGVNKYKTDAEREFREHMAPIFKDAIDMQALTDFNQAAQFYNEVFNELKTMVNDPDCGLNQMKNIQKFFNDQVKNLTSIKDIVTTGFGVISKEIPPAIQHITDFTNELNNALAIAAGQGQKGSAELKKIQEALNTLKQQVNVIKSLDIPGMAASTGDIILQVGGLYTKCVACATAATTTIVGIQKATAETGTAIATPETWEAAGGTAWLLPVAGLDAAVAAAATIASPAACGPMFEAIENINNDIEALKKYYAKVSQAATSVKQSVTLISDAAENLNKLIATASAELKPSLQKLAVSLTSLDQRLDNIFEGINKKVLPKVEAITVTITRQIATNAENLYNCSQEYLAFTERVTSETVAGIRDMFQAATQIVDAAKIMDNMGQGYTNALNAAKNKAVAEFNDVKQSFASLESSLCVKRKSNGSIDVTATANCIKDKLFKNGPEAYLNDARQILQKSSKLASDIIDLAAKAATAAENAYTGKPANTDKARAIAKSRSARDEAASAMAKIKKATKREFAKNAAIEAAKQKAREKLAQAKNNQIVPLTGLTERKKVSPVILTVGAVGVKK
jgi:archaellum component FlaC